MIYKELLNKYDMLKYNSIRNIKSIENEILRRIRFNEINTKGSLEIIIHSYMYYTRYSICFKQNTKNNNPTLED